MNELAARLTRTTRQSGKENANFKAMFYVLMRQFSCEAILEGLDVEDQMIGDDDANRQSALPCQLESNQSDDP